MDDGFIHIMGFALIMLLISVFAGAHSCAAEKNTMCYICRKKPCDGTKVLCEDSAHYYLCKKCAMKIRNEHPPKEIEQ